MIVLFNLYFLNSFEFYLRFDKGGWYKFTFFSSPLLKPFVLIENVIYKVHCVFGFILVLFLSQYCDFILFHYSFDLWTLESPHGFHLKKFSSRWEFSWDCIYFVGDWGEWMPLPYWLSHSGPSSMSVCFNPFFCSIVKFYVLPL